MRIGEVRPDEDGIVQACLLINEVNIRFSGINEPITDIQIGERRIYQRQQLWFNLSIALIEIFDLKIKTKLDQLIWHVKLQLSDFGNMIWSTKDLKDSIHKDTKSAQGNTNKRLCILTPELLFNCINNLSN